MEQIAIEGTLKTPTVNLNHLTGRLEVKGRSIPENPREFYAPLLEWLVQYKAEPHKLTDVHIQFEYFNTSSSKCILDFFKKIEAVHLAGNDVIVNWYYEDDDDYMLEAGEDYRSIIKIPFKMIEVEGPDE